MIVDSRFNKEILDYIHPKIYHPSNIGSQISCRNRNKKWYKKINLLETGIKSQLFITTQNISQYSQCVNAYNLISTCDKKVQIEIGFGRGEHLLDQASQNPDKMFIGAEVFLEGIISIVQNIINNSLLNIKIFYGDGTELIQTCPPHSIATFYIFFIDPWTKNRHIKRRFFCPETVHMLYTAMSGDGEAKIAHDNQEYANQILNFFLEHGGFYDSPFEKCHQFLQNFHTRYQQKAVQKNTPISKYCLHVKKT